MGAIESVLAWLGLKKVVVIAGLFGGGISAAVLPGPLVVLTKTWTRVLIGAVCGAAIAGFGAAPLAAELGKPDYLPGIALGCGLFGLSFVFKVLKAWEQFDLGATLQKVIDKLLGRVKP